MVESTITKNAVIIIQARIGSTRLPGKVMELLKGTPMIGIQLERLKKSGLKVVLATSTNKENDVLVEYVESQGIEVFRGDEQNVLKRYYLAAKKFKAEIIIRVTGDNPLIDGAFIKDTLAHIPDFHERLYVSLGKSHTFPLGMSFESFSFNLLEEAFLNSNSDAELEHVTPYMHQNMPGNIEVKVIHNDTNKSKYRLTVDTAEDFKLIEMLVSQFECEKKSMAEIIRVLDENPDLCRINYDVIQKKWNDAG